MSAMDKIHAGVLNLSFSTDASSLLARFVSSMPMIKRSQVMKTLILDSSMLRDLPFEMELQTLTTLTYLSLAGNLIEYLDFGVSSGWISNNLIDLNFEANQLHTVKQLPKSLTSINLSRNRLHEFPVCLLNCTKLLTLNISWNLLVSVPDSILILTKLRSLAIESCRIHCLPASMLKMASMQEINLKGNEDIDGPPLVWIDGLTPPETLKVCRKWWQILGDVSIIDTLQLADMRLEYLPGSSTGLKSVEVISASNNRIRQLSSYWWIDPSVRVPDEIILNGNIITDIAAESLLLYGRGIKVLRLNKNRLQNPVFGNIGDTLCQLEMAQNSLNSFPPSLSRLVMLDTLDLRWNSITDLDDSSCLGLSRLKELNFAVYQMQNDRWQGDFIYENRAEITSNAWVLCRSQWLKLMDDDSSQGFRFHVDYTGHNRALFPCIPRLWIQQASVKVQKITSLFLNRCNLRILAGWIEHLECLVTLDFSHNSVDFLPSEIGRLHRLKCCIAKNNQISSIAGSVLLLPVLGNFDVSCNQLNGVPLSCKNPPSLMFLSASHNPFKRVPFFCWGHNLNSIVLSSCLLTEFAFDLFPNIPKLEVLWIDHNCLKSLPLTGWSELSSLVSLRINSNFLDFIPSEIACLNRTLSDFCFNENQLNMISSTSSAWSAPSMLEYLLSLHESKESGVCNAAFQYLSEVPRQLFIEVSHLTALDISSSNPSSRSLGPQLVGMHHLKLIKADSCNLTDILPELQDCRNLVILSILDNPIVRINEQVGLIRSLREIRLSDSVMTTMSFPPSSLLHTRVDENDQNVLNFLQKYAKHLEDSTIDISNFEISTIPIQIFERAQQITQILAHHNSISYMPKWLSNLPLMCLDLSFNAIKELEEHVIHLSQLRIMHLESNFIESLPLFFGNLTQLEYLNVSNCPLQDLPDTLSRLVHLKSLNVSKTRLREINSVFFCAWQCLESLNIKETSIHHLHNTLKYCTRLNILDVDAKIIRSPPEAILRTGIASTLQFCSMSFEAQRGLVVYDFSQRQMIEWPIDLCDPEYSRQVIGAFKKENPQNLVFDWCFLQELTDQTIICKKFTTTYFKHIMLLH
jgi:Leucine-rich repeat (LRR) protein